MTYKYSFEITKSRKRSKPRTGIIKTANGNIVTPAYIPPATTATVKSLSNEDLETLGAQGMLANTFHLHLRPGDKLIKNQGGLHKFSGFKKPFITDSGGFQAFSLGFGQEHGVGKLGFFPGEKTQQKKKEKNAWITKDGVQFKSPYDGLKLKLTPKISMIIQQNLGSDIAFAFDECTSPFHDYDYIKKSLDRSHRWETESLKYKSKKQALFGIIQGGPHKDLRLESSKYIGNLDFDGFGVGGTLGKSKQEMATIIQWALQHLPEDKPRHMLGIGAIDDFFICIEKGLDTFDCVNPTRIARRGYLHLTPEGGGTVKNKFRMNIDRKEFMNDPKPIDKNCSCYTCKNHSRAYLNHLFRLKELTYYRLASIHNLHVIFNLMKQIRTSIENNTFARLKKKWMG